MSEETSMDRKSCGKMRLSLGNILIAVVILVGVAMFMNETRLSGYEKEYQAVFLTNGQVYFGKVMSQNKLQYLMEDIYYLQVTRPLQQTEEGQAQATDNQNGELSLVKLGNELHGPTDKMYINRSQVLFAEDLKDDSNVVTAITNYKSGETDNTVSQ